MRNAHHVCVAGKGARSDSEEHPPVGHVVQLDHTVGHHQRVVVWQADDAGAQLNAAGALCGGGDENLRGRDNLPAGAVVLTNPGLIEPQLVQPFNQLQIAFDGQGGVFANTVEWAEEDTKLHSVGKRHIRTSSRAGAQVLHSRSSSNGRGLCSPNFRTFCARQYALSINRPPKPGSLGSQKLILYSALPRESWASSSIRRRIPGQGGMTGRPSTGSG